jgi:hypothetical protein
MAVPVPRLGAAHARLHRDVDEDPSNGVPGAPQVVDPIFRRILPGHGDVPDHVPAFGEGTPGDPLGDMRGLLVDEIRGLHWRQAGDIGYESSPGHLFLDVIGVDGQVPGEVDARVHF